MRPTTNRFALLEPSGLRVRLAPHRAVIAVLGLATIVRVGAAVAYWPALFFSDSWQYLNLAFSRFPVGIAPSRPSGYPLLLRLLSAPGHDFALVVALQHVAGLGAGVLVYALCLRLGLARWVAVLAAAAVILDAYAIALEQHIMAESFFELALMGAMLLTISRRDRTRALVLAGVLLAIAATLRTAALFVIPVWLAFLLWAGVGRRRLLAGAAAVLVPLLTYSAIHYAHTDGSFGLQQAQGWFLYARVEAIADCRGAAIPPATRPLCIADAYARGAPSPDFWIWSSQSPAERAFGGNPDFYVGDGAYGHLQTARIDALLQSYALAIVTRHPLAYARTVGADFGRFFDPHAGPDSNVDGVTVTFPRAPRIAQVDLAARDRYFPAYVPPVRWPSPLLQGYQRIFHAPRLLLGILTLVALLALLAPLIPARQLQVARRPEILLLSGSGVVILLASAMFVAFVVRYLIPEIPLLLCGGLTAINELIRSIRLRREAIAGRRSPGLVEGAA